MKSRGFVNAHKPLFNKQSYFFQYNNIDIIDVLHSRTDSKRVKAFFDKASLISCKAVQ
jgi:hypothetical protein